MGPMSAAALPERSRVASVDSLRCLAMTAVVAQHCGLLPMGWIGVWLFFVISGFVVTLTVIGREVPDRTPPARLRDFFYRRMVRIAPIYYLYVAAGILVCVVADHRPDLLSIFSLLGFFHNVAMAMGRGGLSDWPVGHLWTISVEMQFYLVYGTMLVLAGRRTVVVLLFFALLAAPVLRLFASIGISGSDLGSEASAYWIYSGSFLHVDSFAVGGLLAFASLHGRLHQIARYLAWTGALAVFAYASIYMWLNNAVSEAHGVDILRNVFSGILWGQYREVALYSTLATACGGLVALAATGEKRLDWLLRWRVLRRIGEISYGAYILHAVAIELAAALLASSVDLSDHTLVRRVLIFTLAYLMTLVLAELSFRYFESLFSAVRSSSRSTQARPFATSSPYRRIG